MLLKINYNSFIQECIIYSFHVKKLYLNSILDSWCEFDRASALIYGNKRPTRCNRWFFIEKLIVPSTCFGQHYAHHQELKSIVQVVFVCGTWCFVLQVVGLQLQLHTRPTTSKPKHQVPQAATTCIILLSS